MEIRSKRCEVKGTPRWSFNLSWTITLYSDRWPNQSRPCHADEIVPHHELVGLDDDCCNIPPLTLAIIRSPLLRGYVFAKTSKPLTECGGEAAGSPRNCAGRHLCPARSRSLLPNASHGNIDTLPRVYVLSGRSHRGAGEESRGS